MYNKIIFSCIIPAFILFLSTSNCLSSSNCLSPPCYLNYSNYSNYSNLYLKNILPIKVEKNIDLDSYMGQWYQVASSPSTRLTGTNVIFSQVITVYHRINSIQNTTNMSIIHYEYDLQKNFTLISGFSYSPYNSIPSKRVLQINGLPFERLQWIIKLGPILNNKYQYSIFSVPLTGLWGTRFSLYVLARNITEYQINYEKDVIEWCNNNGFIFPWNKYIKNY